jgi:dimethylhistidine N-methyltransferase
MTSELNHVPLKKEQKAFLKDVIWGLRQRQKQLDCKYFYDERGSKLFDDICQLEEYYPTKTETALLKIYSKEISSQIGSGVCLIEYGCGSLVKTRILLDALDSPFLFIPIDISEEHLLHAAQDLATQYQELKVLPQVADFTQTMVLPKQARSKNMKCVGFFPGSTIGNFNHNEAVKFLSGISKTVGEDGGLLIGVDMKKDREILIRAYDDKSGVTASFNLNLILRINQELGGNFDVSAFKHKALYNETKGRIELHLVSLKQQTVNVQGFKFTFKKGETIHTENSYKYHTKEFTSLAEEAGFTTIKTWVDEKQLFSLHYLKANS